jgi:hypothetical protein
MRNRLGRSVPLALAATLLFAANLHAQPPKREDHLEPEGSIIGGTASPGDYEERLHQAFISAYDRQIAVRMVAIPSFVPEYAVGLRRVNPYGDGPPYRIFGLQAATSIWLAGQKQEHAPQPADSKVQHCDAAIGDLLGQRIVSVWRKMLMNTRYAQQYQGSADGISLHFGMFVAKVGQFAGALLASDRNSATGTLAALANMMRDVCVKKTSEGQLEHLTTELEQRLQRGEGK